MLQQAKYHMCRFICHLNTVCRLIFVCLVFITVTHGEILPEYHTLETDYVKPVSLDYFLYTPPDYHPRQGYPLLLFLTGEEFSNNSEGLRQIGPPSMVEAGMSFNYFIAAPVLSDSALWDTQTLMALIDHIASNYHLEPAHYWVTGYGDQGGWGAWELGLENPGVFEKISVAGSPAGTQIWGVHESSIRIYHGRQDTLVPVEDAEVMYSELNWDNTDVELIIFEDLGHEIRDTVYQDLSFYQWLSGNTPQMGTGKPVPKSLTFSTTITRSFNENYLLYLPENYDRSDFDWPMMIFLHGAGNAIWNIEDIREAEPPSMFEQDIYSDYILLCPQLHDDVHWDVDRLDAITQQVLENYRIDEHRLYITGLSRGGFGTWEYAVTYPNRFAAVVPISARDVAAVERLRNTPVWIFHGDLDDGVPWQGAQFMYHRLRNVSDKVQFTLYSNVGHWAWQPAYHSEDLWQWIFSQVNERATGVSKIRNPSAFDLKSNYPNPFNPMTTIPFSLSRQKHVTLTVFNVQGNTIRKWDWADLPAGKHSVIWDGTNQIGQGVPTGIYVYRLSAGEESKSGKMIFIK